MRTAFITIFTIYILIEIYTIVLLFIKKRKINLKYNLINFIAAVVLLFFIYLNNISIPYIVLIFYIAAMLIASFFGYYLDFYNKSKIFDRYIHGFGSFSTTLLFYFIITFFVQSGGSKLFRGLFILFLGLAIGVIFETIEFMNDLRHTELKTARSLMQKGLKDTDMDIMFNITGSIAAAVFAYIFYL